MFRIQSTLKNTLLVAFVLIATLSFANHHENDSIIEVTDTSHETVIDEHNQVEEAYNPVPVIMHHIADAHDFHLWDTEHNGEVHSVSIPLPVILWTNNGLVTFMSSAFQHDDEGKTIVEKNGQKFVKNHGKIYYASETANEHGSFVELDEEHHALNAMPWDFSITKNVTSLFLAAFIVFALFITVASSYKTNKAAPKGLAGFLEPLVLFVKEDIAIPNIGEKKYAKFLPYLLTLFFFIWVMNLLGLIPFFPGGANVTGNIAVTLVLAVFTLFIVNLNANKNYWKHVFWPPVPLALKPLMIPIEIVGVLTKPFALMIRLFANITAGHIVVLSLVSLIFIFKTVLIAPASIALVLFISVLELLVAALQAYIFTLLTALFIGMAVEEHEHH